MTGRRLHHYHNTQKNFEDAIEHLSILKIGASPSERLVLEFAMAVAADAVELINRMVSTGSDSQGSKPRLRIVP